MSSLTSEATPMRANPFRRKVMHTIDTLGYRVPQTNSWRLLRDGWDMIWNAGDLIFYNTFTMEPVWSDREGGQMVDDLAPYEELMDRWMVLERLADVGSGQDDRVCPEVSED